MRLCHKTAGDPPLRLIERGLVGLARTIVFQQVSSASGNAIWARVQAGIAPFEARTILALSEDELRAFGLSRPKVRTLRVVAEAIGAGRLDLERLSSAPDAEIAEALTSLNGIGPWTSSIYLMFSLGRADAFAAGDLALQEAVRMAMKLEERPKADALEEIAERWRPWRGVAARMLWAYYRVAKQTKGGTPV
jgi:DNA-3-methyladenine glycosylase II